MLVPEIWTKMFSANQIAGFFNQPYLQSKSVKWPDFLHVDKNSHKLKVDQNFLGGHGQSGHGDSKIDCISMNRWNELICCMLVQILEN